jgi:feruloyl esterase
MVTVLTLTQVSAQRPYENLASLSLTNAAITSATSVAGGTYKTPSDRFQPTPRAAIPAFCRVIGVAKPTNDSEIRFEVWLPVSGWNGKFEQVGNGGFAGTIPLPAMAEPLLRGYATAGTDDGHSGDVIDGSWAIGHPEKGIDFGYRAVHEVTVRSKAIIREYYGKSPAQSYWMFGWRPRGADGGAAFPR